MKRRYSDSYQSKALNALIAIVGKPNPLQPVKKLKPSLVAMAEKLAVYIGRAA